MPGGRPTKYSPWIAKGICLRLMLGQSLRAICEEKKYPHRITVLRWVQNNEEFRNQYAQAREVQQELRYDELFEIADDSRNDYMEALNKQGEPYDKFNAENVQRSKLRIDTRKWVMERLSPKKYGAKQSLDHTSSDGSMSNLSDKDIESKLNALMAKKDGVK